MTYLCLITLFVIYFIYDLFVLLPFSTTLLAVARGKSSSQLVAIKTKFKLFIVCVFCM